MSHATPSITTQLLSLLSDPHLSPADVADRLGLTLEDLTVLLTLPATRARLDELDHLAHCRARLCAGSLLPRLIACLDTMIGAYTSDEMKANPQPGSIAERSLASQRPHARRACWLLWRIATSWAPPPPCSRLSASRHHALGGASGRESR